MYRTRVIKNICLICFIFLRSSFLLAQSESSTDEEECQKLIKQGIAAQNKEDFAQALEFYTKAEAIAEREKMHRQRLVIKNQMGVLFFNFNNYGESLEYYKQAYEIASDNKSLHSELPMNLANIGLLYHVEKDYVSAIEYYTRAYNIKEKKSDYVRTLIALNLSDVYNDLGDITNARKYLNEVKPLNKPALFEIGWVVNYAESYVVEGNLNKAQIMVEALYNDKNLSSNKEGYMIVTELLSRIYSKQNKTQRAITFAKKALSCSHLLGERIELYRHLSNLYIKNQELYRAVQYKDSLVIAKDSLAASTKRGLFESNKVKLKVQEYQSELKSNSEKQQIQLVFFFIIIMLCVIIFIGVYKALQNKIQRQGQDKVIMERNQEIINLEFEKNKLELEKKNKEYLLAEKELETTRNSALLQQEQLKNKISEKNRELSAKALYLSIRNELIESSINSLSAIPEIAKNTSVANHIKILKKHLKSNAGWDEFINHFEKINPAFLKVLKEKHPSLTGKDFRFVCCVFMNLDIKEIANIFNITYNAANKRKQRIKEKMEIDNEASLFEYLLKLENMISKNSLLAEDN